MRAALHGEPASKIGEWQPCSDVLYYRLDTAYLVPVHEQLIMEGRCSAYSGGVTGLLCHAHNWSRGAGCWRPGSGDLGGQGDSHRQWYCGRGVLGACMPAVVQASGEWYQGFGLLVLVLYHSSTDLQAAHWTTGCLNYVFRPTCYAPLTPLPEGLRALLYSGDHDMVVPHTGTRMWLYDEQDRFGGPTGPLQPWFMDGQVSHVLLRVTSVPQLVAYNAFPRGASASSGTHSGFCGATPASRNQRTSVHC